MVYFFIIFSCCFFSLFCCSFVLLYCETIIGCRFSLYFAHHFKQLGSRHELILPALTNSNILATVTQTAVEQFDTEPEPLSHVHAFLPLHLGHEVGALAFGVIFHINCKALWNYFKIRKSSWQPNLWYPDSPKVMNTFWCMIHNSFFIGFLLKCCYKLSCSIYLLGKTWPLMGEVNNTDYLCIMVPVCEWNILGSR